MTEEELYNYYYNYFIQDLDKALSASNGRLYIGGSSKKAAELAGELPKDQQSRNIIKRAAEAALKNKGYSAGRTWSPTPFAFRGRYGNSAAKAVLDKFANEKPADNRQVLINPNNIQQDPEQLAMSIVSALQNGQPIDSLIALVPDSPDDLYKSAFIYTIAANYPAKTPEVAKEMQALAQRHQLKATQWKASQKSKLNMNDLLTLGGFNNKNTVKAQEAIK